MTLEHEAMQSFFHLLDQEEEPGGPCLGAFRSEEEERPVVRVLRVFLKGPACPFSNDIWKDEV